jgi:hypothetical protein
MKERPILFNGDMVRAILEGRKTQTRRIVKLPIKCPDTGCELAGCELAGSPFDVTDRTCPYGHPGDRLWVRETWMPDPSCDDDAWDDEGLSYYEWSGCGSSISGIPKALCKVENVIHKASWDGQEMVGWKPSIHMPRWASRITLEIVSVRVERLNEISEQDAADEGFDYLRGDGKSDISGDVQRRWFRCLWESINGNGSWQQNPWVWVVEFKRVQP